MLTCAPKQPWPPPQTDWPPYPRGWAGLDTYRELTPEKLREYFVSVKQQLEEYNDLLDSKLKKANRVISFKEEQIAQLKVAQKLQKTSIESEANLGITVTLEGWARSVELRAGDAEGHTQRLTDMTLKLAKNIGVPKDDIVHVKRGALLHDIGKIGIPDQILHKLGPYTQEEWDGTGYPQGLKGEEIPLAAKIFSLVDVWDSLRTDRVYRSAWPKDKVIQYIQEQAGKIFDPIIVEVFVKFVKQSVEDEPF